MIPKTFTPEELAERNLKDARRLLAAAVKKLRQAGCIVENPQVTPQDDGSFWVELITNEPNKFVFSDHQSVLKHLSIVSTSVHDGFYDWVAQTFIKPSVSCIAQELK